MNKTHIKTSLLIIAFLIAIGGVLWFVKDILAPPQKAIKTEVYMADIENFIKAYNPASSSITNAEDSLDLCFDRINLFYGDSLIDAKSQAELGNKSIDKFLYAFKYWSYDKFKQSVWNSSDHKEISRIIKKLRGYTSDNGNRIISTDQESVLMGIEKVIDNYNAAWAASRKTDFANYSTNIANANKYKTMEYICNCTALVNALTDLPNKIAQNQYNTLNGKLNSLSNFHNYKTLAAFNTASGKISSEIQTFKKASLGVNVKNYVDKLQSRLNSINNSAKSHFEPKAPVTPEPPATPLYEEDDDEYYEIDPVNWWDM